MLLQTRWKPEEGAKYSGLQEIPGRRMEYGEDLYTTLKREVKEECGLNIESIKLRIDIKAEGKWVTVSVAFVFFWAINSLAAITSDSFSYARQRANLHKSESTTPKNPDGLKYLN